MPCIFTTQTFSTNFITQNSADLDARKVVFESVNPRLQGGKKFFFVSFTFLMLLYIINNDISVALAKTEAK